MSGHDKNKYNNLARTLRSHHQFEWEHWWNPSTEDKTQKENQMVVPEWKCRSWPPQSSWAISSFDFFHSWQWSNHSQTQLQKLNVDLFVQKAWINWNMDSQPQQHYWYIHECTNSSIYIIGQLQNISYFLFQPWNITPHKTNILDYMFYIAGSTISIL